jgi:hypothetical protein
MTLRDIFSHDRQVAFYARDTFLKHVAAYRTQNYLLKQSFLRVRGLTALSYIVYDYTTLGYRTCTAYTLGPGVA